MMSYARCSRSALTSCSPACPRSTRGNWRPLSVRRKRDGAGGRAFRLPQVGPDGSTSGFAPQAFARSAYRTAQSTVARLSTASRWRVSITSSRLAVSSKPSAMLSCLVTSTKSQQWERAGRVWRTPDRSGDSITAKKATRAISCGTYEVGSAQADLIVTPSRRDRLCRL